jgi:hypothetical protein
MKIKEGLTVREAIKYAKDNGFDKEMFRININDKYVISGKFLDAYYEMVLIPVMGSGFTRFQELCNTHGERNISIDIVDEEEFKSGVSFDFIIRGKFAEIPEEYKIY